MTTALMAHRYQHLSSLVGSADKTRRGLRGRVELGKFGGGLCYDYRVRRATGEREIVPAEAEVVRRIFSLYSMGMSPKALVRQLNAERCPGPSGAPWNPSTIHGNPARGTGILNNELYIGRLVWNRLRYVKDPGAVNEGYFSWGMKLAESLRVAEATHRLPE